MFDDLWDSRVHVIEPFPIPGSWRIDRSFDWGSARPFSVGWWAESDGTEVSLDGNGRVMSWPRGTLFRIGEWYGCSGNANEGLRMPDTEIARGIVQREQQMGIYGRVRPGPADNQIFNRDHNTADSTANIMDRHGVRFVRSDKTSGSRVRGWQAIRDRLAASAEKPVERPGMYVFDVCCDFISIMPALSRSEKNPEDIDTDTEDHIADETRYRVAWRPNQMTVTRW